MEVAWIIDENIMAVTPSADSSSAAYSPLKKEIFQVHAKFSDFFGSSNEDVFKPALDSLTNTSSTINDEEVR